MAATYCSAPQRKQTPPIEREVMAAIHINPANTIRILESELESLKALQKLEHKERIESLINMLTKTSKGEWDEIKNINPQLHEFVRQAVNR